MKMDLYRLLTNKLVECNGGVFEKDLICQPTEEQRQKLMEGSGNPEAEMRQVNSSAGLAVNYWRAVELSDPDCKVEFEWKRQVPLKRGLPANIDVVLRWKSGVNFIESKFLEPYYSGNEVPRTSYFDASKYSKDIGPACQWVELFKKAVDFKYYNVVQLCRHLLAIYKDMRRNQEEYNKKEVCLLSYTWEMPDRFIELFPKDVQGVFNERRRVIEEEADKCERLLNNFLGWQLEIDPDVLCFSCLTYNRMNSNIEDSPYYSQIKKQYFL